MKNMEEEDLSFDDLKDLIKLVQGKLDMQLPELEANVKELIGTKSTDEAAIEGLLDTLLSLANIGKAEQTFIDLLKYYKTVNNESADYYWNEYDKD